MASRSTAVVAVGGLVLGLGIAAAMVWTWSDDPGDDHASASAAFVEAWERSRNGTYVVRSDFHRRTSSGRELDSEVLLVQRPPDYLLHQFGSVEGRLDGRVVGCSPDPDGQTVCRPTGERSETSHEEMVAREVANFEQYFSEGDHPLYRVTEVDDDCYELHLTRLLPSAPYGDEARFCFDDESGAVTLVRIQRPEGTDVTEAVDIRTDLTEADFRLTG